ncbi:MAG: hypothetical protein ABI647_18560 [Gemmatimonadota bacterium]
MTPKAPPTGTAILVRVLDAKRNPVPDVLIEIQGKRGSLNPLKSDSNSADGVFHPGEKSWTIMKDEFGGNKTMKILVRAHKPNSDLGAVPPGDPPDWSKFVPGIADFTMTLVLGQPDFVEILLYDRATARCLAALPMPAGQRLISRFAPPDYEISARDLTLDQARAVLDFLHVNGQITLMPSCAPTLNADCTVTQTKKSDVNIQLRAWPYGVRIITNTAGTSAVNAIDTPGQGGSFVLATAISNIDVRNAVGLVRVIKFLRDQFEVSEFLHAGIGQGSGAFDCHSEGRAVDFVGVRIPDPEGTGSILVYVQEAWGSKKVPKEAGLGKPFDDPARRPLDPAWPFKSFTKLEYRLDSHIDEAGKPPLSRTFNIIRGFWTDMFRVIVKEYRSSASTNQKPGEDGFVMHPDHPTSDTFQKQVKNSDGTLKTNPDGTPAMVRANGSGGREAHLGHLHFQIGATGPEMPCTTKLRPGKTAIVVHGQDCIHGVRPTC